MKKNIYLNLLVAITLFVCANGQALGYDIKHLLPGKVHNSPLRNGHERLSIYCYKGVPKHILHFWQTVTLHLSLDSEEFISYKGSTPDEVLEEFDQHRNSWSLNLFSWNAKSQYSIDPFNASCVGVATAADHTALVHIIRIDFWRVLAFFGGVLLFLASPRLSSNPLFYYICGITVGVTASILIVVYLLGRIVPRGPTMFGVMIGGWTIGMYLLRLVWQNTRTVLLLYQNYVLAYISLSALISFCVCYRFGPVSDARTKKLIQWTLQVGSLISMFLSSQFQEASLAVILCFLLYYNFPSFLTTAVLTSWRKTFPPKRKLLLEDEYHEQGARETVKALDELRKYCSSPECNQWKTVLRLKKPLRFAEFMEGKSHLNDDEILEYESDNMKPAREISEDSDSDF